MYSIPSNENDYYTGYYYDSGFRGAENIPIYPYAGGQPYVYYSHIAQENCPQRNKVNKKNNPNCFVKAFRWYTQELPSPQLVAPCNNVNIGGFATWLDKKYEEYLYDNQCENICPQYTTRQCSITKSNRTVNRLEYTPRKTRRFPRLKSPWKKKHRYVNETEKDVLCEKQSFEFILRPQDMSRPASECCQRTSYCVRSDTTFITSKSVIPTKTKKKSISMIYIRNPKDGVERDITTYDFKQSKKNHTSEERSRELTGIKNQQRDSKSSAKPNTDNITCDCNNTDLNIGMHNENIDTARNHNRSVNGQCKTETPSVIEKHKAFKMVSYNELNEKEYDFNKRNVNTQRSEESRIVTEHTDVTIQKVNSNSQIKLNTKDVICGCDQSDFKELSSYKVTPGKKNKTVVCQCSMFNFQKDIACQHVESKMSYVLENISRNDFNKNEYDNKYNIKRQTSVEQTKVVTKYIEQANKKHNSNTQMNRKSKDVICECTPDKVEHNNVMNQYKAATRVHDKTVNCQCTGNVTETDNDHQYFDNREQYICRKDMNEKVYQTCCQCPKPFEPRLQVSQIKQSSKNFSGVKTLKCKMPLTPNEFPVHSVQTSNHSIRFHEDSFLVKII